MQTGRKHNTDGCMEENKQGEFRHTHTQRGTSSEVFLIEVEAEVFTLSFDDFGQSRRAAVKHMDFPFLLLRHLLEHLTHTCWTEAELPNTLYSSLK